MLLMLVSAAAGSALTVAPLLHYLNYLRSCGGHYHSDPMLKYGAIAAYLVAGALTASAMFLLFRS